MTVLVQSCLPQVLSPPEILDPAMRALQQKHLPELKAAAVDIASHQYPYRFYLSRKLDLTERQEQQNDQRSIRFSNFQGHTVLQVTGNYFAAYSEESMNQNERVKQTYLDVMLPILRATASRLAGETELNAFAIEVAHHVRKKVLGVAVEHPENLALIVPFATAERIAASTTVDDQMPALLESRVFIDGKPASLWPGPAEETPPAPPVAGAVASPPPSAIRDLSPSALSKQQAVFQGMIDRIVHDLDAEAHFTSYAPPVLVGFHGKSYLQLSITTDVAPNGLGSQYRIAALAFDRHVSHLIRPLIGIVSKDSDFDGIVFSSTVTAASESIEFFFPLSELRRYAEYDLTGLFLDRTATILGAAEAADSLGLLSEIVVDSEFFARLDHAKAYVQYVTLHYAADQVWFATVIYDFSAAPADSAIDSPVIVEHKQVRVVRILSLPAVEPFAGIFDHFAVDRNQFPSVDPVAMNCGLPDRKLENRIARIDTGSAYQNSSHTRCILANRIQTASVMAQRIMLPRPRNIFTTVFFASRCCSWR